MGFCMNTLCKMVLAIAAISTPLAYAGQEPDPESMALDLSLPQGLSADSIITDTVMMAPEAHTQSAPALEASSVASKPALSVKPETASSKSRSGSASSEISVYRQAEAFIDPSLSAERAAQLSTAQHALELAKLEMLQVETQNQIAEMRAQQNRATVESMLSEKESQWKSQAAQMAQDYETRIASLEANIRDLTTAKQDSAEQVRLLKEEMYVTQVYGIGQNMSATIYHDNNIVKRRVGEEVIDGVFIKSIDPNGVLFTFSGTTQYVAITTSEHAHYKTFAADAKESGLPPELQGLEKTIKRLK